MSTPAKFAVTFAAYVRIAVRNAEVMSQSGIGQDFNVGEDSWTGAEVCSATAVHAGQGGHLARFGSARARVGGTSLTANPVTGAYISETVWDNPSTGSGGGFSHLFAQPAYQDGVPGIGATRGVPDVAADGEGSTGMALAFSAPGGGYELIGAGGTSAGARSGPP